MPLSVIRGKTISLQLKCSRNFPEAFPTLRKKCVNSEKVAGIFFICLSKLRAVTSEAIDIGGAFIAKIKRGFTDSTHCWKLWQNNSIYSISSPKRKCYKRSINQFRVSLHNLWGIQCISRKSNFYGMLRYFCTDMQNFYSELRYSLSFSLSLFLSLAWILPICLHAGLSASVISIAASF